MTVIAKFQIYDRRERSMSIYLVKLFQRTNLVFPLINDWYLQDVGTTVRPEISTVAIGVVRMVVGLLTSFLLRRFGRRPLYMISGLGMAAAMFVCGYITREVSEGQWFIKYRRTKISG